MQCLLAKVFAAPLIETSVCLTRSFIIIDSATCVVNIPIYSLFSFIIYSLYYFADIFLTLII